MAIINGTLLAAKIKTEQANVISHYQKSHGSVPSLVIILVGDDLASLSYVRGKVRAAEEIGMDVRLIHLATTISQAELLAEIQKHNQNEKVDGIIVQLPLPEHIDPDTILESIAIRKDVDGFHPHNVARLWLSEPCVQPCTPKGIMRLLHEIQIPIEGANVVVVGRGNIVGKPIAKLLLDANATVTIAHSKSRNLAEITRRADILVTAVGKRNTIKSEMIKEGAVVIDVGINRDPIDGKLYGDADFENVSRKASFITPVPGGVGPMTICMLLENTIESYEKKINKNFLLK